MMKRKNFVSRARLLEAMENTYEDARFLIGASSAKDSDFKKGLVQHTSEFWSKEQVLKAISESGATDFCSVPGYEDYLVLNSHLVLYRGSINQEQVFPQLADADDFTHIYSKGQPHYDVYLKFDHGEKTITFALGNSRKTLKLIEHTEWAWKLTETSLLCGTSEALERSFLDDFWYSWVIQLGRAALEIRDII